MIGKNLKRIILRLPSAYTSKHNSVREKPVIFLMIRDGEGWHYFSVKKLSALLRGIT